MARFCLRNQSKIEKALGKDFLKWLLLSVKNHFETHKEIKEYDYPGERYKVVLCENVQPHTDSTFELYIIRKRYDVYNLAYKSCMS